MDRPLNPHELRTNAIIASLIRYYAADSKPSTPKEESLLPSFFTTTKQDVEAEGDKGPRHESSNSLAPAVDLPTDAYEVRLRHDPTLVAFAQLGATRLGCQRSFISLIDFKDQYILAEATQSVSLQDRSKFLPGDGLYIGAAKLPVAFGVCPDTIHVFREEEDAVNVSSTFVTANKHCYIMNDMSQVECFKDKPYVAGWPWVRFYAEVPLRTTNGHVIGSYCVTDTKPRAGLDPEGLEKLHEIADVILDHLQLIQAQSRLERSNSMIQGLSRFVDGKATQELWKDTFDGQLSNLPEQVGAAFEQKVGFATTISSRSPLPDEQGGETYFPEYIENSSLRKEDSEEFSVAATATLTSRRPTETLEESQLENFRCNGSLSHEPARNLTLSPEIASAPHESDNAPLEEGLFQLAIKNLFSRAGYWIREACDFDGILFVDASLQDVDVAQFHHTGEKRSQKASTSRVEGSGANEYTKNGYLNILQGSFTPTSPRLGTQSPTCDLVGYSLGGPSHRSTGLPSSTQAEISQSTLGCLLRQYSHGKIFHFDEHGHLLPTETVENETLRSGLPSVNAWKHAKFEREKEQLRAYQLLDVCPGARAIVFFPLWDPHKDRWYAGSLAWSTSPARTLQPEELTFLGAFGSCVMAEKAKIEALTAETAKQDFISSVSHEIRSPLHGILATVDSLADTKPNIAQDEMIRTIITCGEVLLDTMDHILDYSKIARSHNKLSALTGQQKRLSDGADRASRVTTFDLSRLVENVVEGTFAGHNYRSSASLSSKTSAERGSQNDLYRGTRNTPPNMNPNVIVIVEIERQASWLYESQIGAWKRILTNIFGNALKYTEAGFVRVSLEVSLVPAISETSQSLLHVVALEVEDSGIGMSRDFLKHRMYTPFAQANPHSVGTGLGLSIVHQLVKDLGGTIVIESQVEYGTRAKINVPLPLSTSEQEDMTSAGINASIRDIGAWCKGLEICLVGFDYYPEIEETPTGILSVTARRMLAIRSSITTFAADWFGLRITRSPSLAEATGDILIGLRSRINASEYISRSQPLVMLEDFHTGSRPQDEIGVFHLSQPGLLKCRFGPHKLARVLGLCLEYRWSLPVPESDKSVPPQPGPGPGLDRGSFDYTKTTSLPVIKSSGLAVSTGLHKHLQPTRSPSPSQTHTSGYSLGRHVSHPVLSPIRHPVAEIVAEPRGRFNVLLVEDNAVNMKILVNLMKRAKEQHLSAINGLEAVHIYQANHETIKVIFMDISMPVKDGIAATKEIRQFEKENSLPRVRIVAVTCFSSEEYQRNAFRSGVDMFIIKPTPMKSLKPILEMDPYVVVPP